MHKEKDDKRYRLLWDDIDSPHQQEVPIYAPDHPTAFLKAEEYFWDTYEHRAGEVIVSTGLMGPDGESFGPVSIPASAVVLLATGRVEDAVKLAETGKLGFMGINPR